MGQERRHFTDEFKTEVISLLAGSGRRLVEIAGVPPAVFGTPD
jgi:transposase-like protein